MQGMAVSFTESGSFDFARSRGTLSMGGPVGFTEVYVPPKTYIKMPASGGASLPRGKSLDRCRHRDVRGSRGFRARGRPARPGRCGQR
jgi:hypothetical protein